MDGWMDGWMDGKAGLRIAYSNQKVSEIQTVWKRNATELSEIQTSSDFRHSLYPDLFQCLKPKLQPGPASTVEERSLRNIPSEGTVVRNSPWICLFRRDLFFALKV